MIHLEPVTDYVAVAELIRQQGFAVLDIGERMPWAFALPIFAGLRQLKLLPPEVQGLWSVDRSLGNPVDPDDGLIIRRADRVNLGAFDPTKRPDNKNVFMYRPQTRLWIARRGVGVEPEWDPFWSSQQTLWTIAWDIALRTAAALDMQTAYQFSVHDGLLRTAGETKLRSQMYIGPRDDNPDMIAQTHTDRSCITVHLCEDHPGLVILPDGTPIHVPASPGRVIIFAGSQLQQMTGGQPVHEEVQGKIRTRVVGGLIQALEHGAAFVDTVVHPWPGYRHMCVLFVKGFHDENDSPYGP